jgi:hypothetical protein
MINEKEVEDTRKAGKTSVPYGTLQKIINEQEGKAGLSVNSISLNTVRSRVKSGNVAAINANQISPIDELEPLIYKFCMWLGKMGRPLTIATIIELANVLVSGTEFESKVYQCKLLQKLKHSDKLGNAWYRGFLSHYQDVLTRSGSAIKDIKWRTWAATENFLNTHENTFAAIVEAGIAEEVEDAIQYDTGLLTKHKLTKPEFLLFVVKTGCNTTN